MSTLPQSFVLIKPRHLTFDNVKLNVSRTQSITLQNTLTYPISLELTASNAFRYKLSASKLSLQSNEFKQIVIELTLSNSFCSKFSSTITDAIHIKSDFFNDHITASIIMSNHQHSHNHEDDDNRLSVSPDTFNHAQSTLSDNKSTKNYISSLEQNVSELKVELDYLNSVKSEMNAQLPDLETIVDATISKERALNEVRNKKVLLILQSKDEQIENLKQMSKNYQAMETALHVLQRKHIDLSQTLAETQHQNIELTANLNQHKQKMSKLNEQIASYSQQSEFQKKIISERDLRINELTCDVEETQKMLQKSTATMKASYAEQMDTMQSKLDESHAHIRQISNEFDEHKIETAKKLQSMQQILAENRDLREYKASNVAIFEKELKAIQMDAATDDYNQSVNQLQIELAKVRSFVRLGLFGGDGKQNENCKDINQQIAHDLARKSAHLSASRAIIQQQKNRICELEKLQKMSNQSCFDQSIKLNETNKKLSNNSSESHRLLAIHQRQIDILNKKLSDSIHREEQSSIKLKALKEKLNHSETEYVDKIEELEEALQAINALHEKSSTTTKRKRGGGRTEMINLENNLISTQNELYSIRKKLKFEMSQRQNEIKSHHIKMENIKKLHETQLNRLQSLVDSQASNDAKTHRLIELNNELAQSEQLKNEYLTQLQLVQNTNQPQPQVVNGTNTIRHNRDGHKLLLDQSEEIQQLKDMLAAAVSVKFYFTFLLTFNAKLVVNNLP